jgi:PAS domain S-box-containing protein
MSIESDSQFRALIEESSDMIGLVDQEGTVQYQSPSIERVLGYDAEEFVGENAFEYVHPEDRDQVLDAFQEAINTPGFRSERVEYRFRHAEQSWVWLESTTTNRTETDLDGYVITSRSIEERKEQEQQLAEERDKYESLVANTQDVIGIIQGGETMFVNQSSREIFGYEPSELIGEPFYKVILPEDRDFVRNRYQQRVDPESDSPPAQYEARIRTKSGEERVVEVSASAIQYEGDSASLVTFRDVTERKEYEQALEERTEELEALNRLVRHDIRNDMAVILGWAETLDGYIEPEGEEYLQKIQQSGEHIVELTEIARDFVESLQGSDDTTVDSTGLRSILSTEFELLRESHPNAEFRKACDIPDVDVRANELLGSVFRNLLTNAVQHTDKETPIVEVDCEVNSEDVEVRIADNGPGVPDEQKDSIFGKGEKGLDSPGTGIGLYLVQALIDQYDGRVWVEDNDPEGAVFSVQLPRVT